MRDEPRVGSSQLAHLTDRPGERHDEQDERNGDERLAAASEGAQHRHQRQDVAVEVRVERHELDGVDEDEGREDEIRAPGRELVLIQHKRPEREREPDRGDQQHGPQALPQPVEERDRRRMVVLEAEPALAGQALDPGHVVPGGAGVQEDERARQRERRQRETRRRGEPAPATPAGEQEGHGEKDAPGTSRRPPGRSRRRPTPADRRRAARGRR